MSGLSRTTVLGGLAGGLILILAVSSLVGTGEGDSSPGLGDGRAAEAAVRPLPGAPRGLTVAELDERYEPVLNAGLFTPRSFKDRPKASPRKPREARVERSSPKGPADIALRLTGFVGVGASRAGVFEERGTGQGLIAKAGAKLGATEVAAVQTRSLVLLEAGRRRELALGDTYDLDPTHRSALGALRPKTAPAAVKSDGSKPAVEISDEKRMSILERLKARRRRSIGSKKKDSDDESN